MSQEQNKQPIVQHIQPGFYRTMYPIYAAAYDGEGLFVTAGGGGSKQHGVLNYLQCHVLNNINELVSVSTLSTGDDTPTSIFYSPSLRVWVAAVKYEVVIFRVSDGSLFEFQPLARFEVERGHPCRAVSLGLRSGQQILITGSENGFAKLWTWRFGEIPRETLSVFAGIDGNKDNDVVSVDLAETGSCFLTLTRSGILKVWDSDTSSCLYSVSSPDQGMNGRAAIFVPSSLVASPGSISPILVSYYAATKTSSLVVYDPVSRKETVVSVGKNVLSCLSRIRANGDFFVGFASGQGELWRLSYSTRWIIRRSQAIIAVRGHDLPISSAALLSDGTVLSVGPDFNILVWTSRYPSWFSALLRYLAGCSVLILIALSIINAVNRGSQ